MPKMTGNWTRASVSGHACDVYEPQSRNELGLVLIYLHGYHLEDLRDKPAFVEQFDRHRLPVIVPWVGSHVLFKLGFKEFLKYLLYSPVCLVMSSAWTAGFVKGLRHNASTGSEGG